jgi:hypothetical protein
MKTLILIFIGLLMVSCSDPKKMVIPQDVKTWESDTKLKEAIGKLPESDQKLFAQYVVRTQLSSILSGEVAMKEGITIGEAIKIQSEWQVEQDKEEVKRKALAEDLQKRQLEATKVMNEAVTVTLMKLRFVPSDYEEGRYSDCFEVRVGFSNNTNKDIIGVKGTVVLDDVFGDKIKRIGISDDDGIKTNSTKTYSGTMNYNQFKDEDVKLRSTSFDKIKFNWEPETYLFGDGTKMEMANE